MDDRIERSLADLERLVTSEESANELRQFFEECFRLPGNPFPPGGIADPSGENPPLDDETFSRIVAFIRHTYSTRRRQFLVIRGDYGTGKTHTLRFIERIINTMMNKGDRAARAVYVERPRIEAQELNRAILRSLGFDTVRKYVWYSISNQLALDIQENTPRLQSVKEKLTQMRLPRQRQRSSIQGLTLWSQEELAKLTPIDSIFNVSVINDYRTFLDNLESNGWTREDVRHYLVTLLLDAIGTDSPTDLAQLFVALLLAPDEASFSSWETLVGITNTRAKSTLRTPDFLRFLLRLMEVNGIAYVYLLLDEFEEVSQGHLLSARQRQDYLYTIREVLNSVQEGLSIIMAISPGGWDDVIRVATPLADVNDRPLDLSRVTVQDAEKLVRFYFWRARRNTVFAGEEDIAPITLPLLEEVLEEWPAGIQLTARNFIQFLHFLFEYAAENKICDLTPETTVDLLESFGLAKSTGGRSARGRQS